MKSLRTRSKHAEAKDPGIKSWMFILSCADAELMVYILAMMHNLIAHDFWFDRSHHHLMLTTTFEFLSKGFPHV